MSKLVLTDFISANEDPEKIFELEVQLGSGSYGEVHKALHRSSGQFFAVKIVPTNGEIQSLMSEINILKECKSDYIVRYYGSYFKNNHLWLIMEYCAAGSVIDLMRVTKRSLNEKQIASILQFTLQGLEYLHKNKKIHRDIKAGNILLDQNGNAKLADFGVSAELMNTLADKDTVIGTPFWMSPEIISKCKYNKKTDIWSLGITSIEMAEGQPPYSHIHPIRAMFAIKNNPPTGLTSPEKWSTEFTSFVKKCLIVDPKKRPNARELLSDPFILKNASKQILSDLVSQSLGLIDHYRLIQFKKNQQQIEMSELNQQLQQQNQQIQNFKKKNNQNNNNNQFDDPYQQFQKQGNQQHKQNQEQDNFKYNESGTMIEHEYSYDTNLEVTAEMMVKFEPGQIIHSKDLYKKQEKMKQQQNLQQQQQSKEGKLIKVNKQINNNHNGINNIQQQQHSSNNIFEQNLNNQVMQAQIQQQLQQNQQMQQIQQQQKQIYINQFKDEELTQQQQQQIINQEINTIIINEDKNNVIPDFVILANQLYDEKNQNEDQQQIQFYQKNDIANNNNNIQDKKSKISPQKNRSISKEKKIKLPKEFKGMTIEMVQQEINNLKKSMSDEMRLIKEKYEEKIKICLKVVKYLEKKQIDEKQQQQAQQKQQLLEQQKILQKQILQEQLIQTQQQQQHKQQQQQQPMQSKVNPGEIIKTKLSEKSQQQKQIIMEPGVITSQQNQMQNQKKQQQTPLVQQQTNSSQSSSTNLTGRNSFLSKNRDSLLQQDQQMLTDLQAGKDNTQRKLKIERSTSSQCKEFNQNLNVCSQKENIQQINNGMEHLSQNRNKFQQQQQILQNIQNVPRKSSKSNERQRSSSKSRGTNTNCNLIINNNSSQNNKYISEKENFKQNQRLSFNNNANSNSNRCSFTESYNKSQNQNQYSILYQQQQQLPQYSRDLESKQDFEIDLQSQLLRSQKDKQKQYNLSNSKHNSFIKQQAQKNQINFATQPNDSPDNIHNENFSSFLRGSFTGSQNNLMNSANSQSKQIKQLQKITTNINNQINNQQNELIKFKYQGFNQDFMDNSKNQFKNFNNHNMNDNLSNFQAEIFQVNDLKNALKQNNVNCLMQNGKKNSFRKDNNNINEFQLKSQIGEDINKNFYLKK